MYNFYFRIFTPFSNVDILKGFLEPCKWCLLISIHYWVAPNLWSILQVSQSGGGEGGRGPGSPHRPRREPRNAEERGSWDRTNLSQTRTLEPRTPDTEREAGEGNIILKCLWGRDVLVEWNVGLIFRGTSHFPQKLPNLIAWNLISTTFRFKLFKLTIILTFDTWTMNIPPSLHSIAP